MEIIDFHSHILSGIDDGSRNIDMTMEMLRAEKKQEVDKIVLTPHFYAEQNTLNNFLKTRNESWKKLEQNLDLDLELLLGAEVAFFLGIGKASGIEQLCIGETSCMLLEMPFDSWDISAEREIDNLLDRGIFPILAHVERYYKLQKKQSVFEEILDLPVAIQLNAGSFLKFSRRKWVMNMLQYKDNCILGSDCHNMDKRSPNLGSARKMIEKKLGTEYLMRIDTFGNSVLESDV